MGSSVAQSRKSRPNICYSPLSSPVLFLSSRDGDIIVVRNYRRRASIVMNAILRDEGKLRGSFVWLIASPG